MFSKLNDNKILYFTHLEGQKLHICLYSVNSECVSRIYIDANLQGLLTIRLFNSYQTSSTKARLEVRKREPSKNTHTPKNLPHAILQ